MGIEVTSLDDLQDRLWKRVQEVARDLNSVITELTERRKSTFENESDRGLEIAAQAIVFGATGVGAYYLVPCDEIIREPNEIDCGCGNHAAIDQAMDIVMEFPEQILSSVPFDHKAATEAYLSDQEVEEDPDLEVELVPSS